MQPFERRAAAAWLRVALRRDRARALGWKPREQNADDAAGCGKWNLPIGLGPIIGNGYGCLPKQV